MYEAVKTGVEITLGFYCYEYHAIRGAMNLVKQTLRPLWSR